MTSTPIEASALLENGQTYTLSFDVADIGVGNWNDGSVAAALASDPDLGSIQVSSQAAGFFRNISAQVMFVFRGPSGTNTISDVAQNIMGIINSLPGLSFSQFSGARIGTYAAPVGVIGAVLGTSTSTDPNQETVIGNTATSFLSGLNSTIKWSVVGVVGLLLLVVVISHEA